jgi:hypothetical protein
VAEGREAFALPGIYSYGYQSNELLRFNAPTELTLLRDEKHPGLVGVHVRAGNMLYTLWVDPARDDVPVEFECRGALTEKAGSG